MSSEDKQLLDFWIRASIEGEWGDDAEKMSSRFYDEGLPYLGGDNFVTGGYSNIVE
jgi:hypothetical protein